eukprot:2953034-Rhodomonas_salina.1
MQGWRLGIGRSRHQVAPTAAVAPPHCVCGGEGGEGAAGGAEAAGACVLGWRLHQCLCRVHVRLCGGEG